MKIDSNCAPLCEDPKPRYTNRDALSDILRFVRADSAILRLLALLLLLLLASAIFNAAVPVLVKRLVDYFAVSNKSIPIYLAVAYICAQGIARVCSELRWRVYGRTEQRVNRRLALRLFDHVHGLSLRFHLERHTGSLQRTVGNDMLGYCIVLQNALYVVIPLALDLLLGGVVIWTLLRPIYVVILFVVTALYILATTRGVERNQSHQRKAAAAEVEASGLATDSYLNYETMKYFDCSGQIRRRFDESLERCQRNWTSYYDGRTALGLLQAFCLTIGLAAIVVFALLDLSHGTLTVGGFVLIISYYLQITRPLEGFGFAFREIATGLTYCRQAGELMHEPPDIQNHRNAKPLLQPQGEVFFDHVSFAYNPERPILQDVTFRIPAGHTVAVVGPSGAGKSTLSRLLFRFYEVSSGAITIDGHPITDVTIGSVRNAVAIVPQDTVLFNDTIAFNIGIAKPDSTRDEIRNAARLAGIAELIESLLDGYDQVVGERGLKLSGGERQRIGIARAVLKQPRIFIFDEATSSLDSETELLIQRNIEQVARGTTTLMIAHRLSTVTHADEILVLGQGRIQERGSHQELLSIDGVYAKMWSVQQQTRGRILNGEAPVDA